MSSVPPDKVYRTRPEVTPTWQLRQEGDWTKEEPLLVQQLTNGFPERRRIMLTGNDNAVIMVHADFVEDLVERLRAARDWRDES